MELELKINYIINSWNQFITSWNIKMSNTTMVNIKINEIGKNWCEPVE